MLKLDIGRGIGNEKGSTRHKGEEGREGGCRGNVEEEEGERR